MNEKESCQCVGAPDFRLVKCERCRDQADPLYKHCLTLRITEHILKVPLHPEYSQIPEGAEFSPEYS